MYMKNKLPKFITDFDKSYGTQHSLVTMLEKWKNALDKKEYSCALLMDLPMAFDTINYDLLLITLNSNGFSVNTLNLMSSYLKT